MNDRTRRGISVVCLFLASTCAYCQAESPADIRWSFQAHSDEVCAVAFSNDSQLVATGGDHGNVQVWDTATGEPRATGLQHLDRVEAVAFSTDGKTLLTGSADNTAGLWDVATGRLLHLLPHQERVWAAAFSPDGKVVVLGDSSFLVRGYAWATGRPLGQPLGGLHYPHGSVRLATFGPGGRTVRLGWGRVRRLWGVAPRDPEATPRTPEGSAAEIFSGPAGQLIMTRGPQSARLWDASGRAVGPVGAHSRYRF